MKQTVNLCLKKYTGEARRKVKERTKEVKDDGEKTQKYKKITRFSQHMKTTSHPPLREHVRIIYREHIWKKRKLKKAARIT